MSSLIIETRSFWFAAVSIFQHHNCKVWFGKPVQVCTFSDILFIPISHIKSRVAYASTTINFGRIIGQDHVLVVVPLVNDMHFV